MTTLKLKNYELAPAANLLASLTLKPRASRNRSKLLRLLMAAIEESDKDLAALNDEYVLRDAKGEPVPTEDGKGQKIQPDRANEYTKELEAFNQEQVIIEGGTFTQNIDAFYQDLLAIDKDLSGAEADIYDRLLDAYEANSGIKGDG